MQMNANESMNTNGFKWMQMNSSMQIKANECKSMQKKTNECKWMQMNANECK